MPQSVARTTPTTALAAIAPSTAVPPASITSTAAREARWWGETATAPDVVAVITPESIKNGHPGRGARSVLDGAELVGSAGSDFFEFNVVLLAMRFGSLVAFDLDMGKPLEPTR